jgi:transposase
MFKSRPKQPTFAYGPDVFAKLIPRDHFLRKVNQVVNFKRVNDLCRDLYCPDNGRAVTNTPEMMMRASFVQRYYVLSDRDLEEHVNLNLAAREFVGFNLEQEVFHFDALSDFRLRLGEARFKVIFDDILCQAYEQGLMSRDEVVNTDATHIIADVAIPSTIRLIGDYIRRIVKVIREAKPEMLSLLPLGLMPYTKDKNESEPKEHTLNEENRKERLTRIANDAIELINWYETLTPQVRTEIGDSALNEIKNLNRILHDYLERKRSRGRPPKDQDSIMDGKGELKEREEKGKDRIVSAVDPDARHGAKSKTKHFTGNKIQTTQNKSGLTVAVKVVHGNLNDEGLLLPQIEEMAKRGIKPKKVIADGIYGSEANRIEFENKNMILSSPLRKPSNPHGLFPASSFTLQDDSVTCPDGKVAVCISCQDGRRNFRFKENDCQACPLKARCTRTRSRTVSFTANYEVIQRATEYQATEQYKQDKKDRTAIERSYSEAKESHGLRRARYRTIPRIAIQAFLTFIVINVKRMIVLATTKAEKLCATAHGGGGLAVAFDARAVA